MRTYHHFGERREGTQWGLDSVVSIACLRESMVSLETRLKTSFNVMKPGSKKATWA